MTELLNMLHTERTALAKKLAGIDAAIHALNGNVVVKRAVKSAPVKSAPVKRKRKMSAETKAKLRKAAKLRWAKIKR
jgi:hypothetical protein